MVIAFGHEVRPNKHVAVRPGVRERLRDGNVRSGVGAGGSDLAAYDKTMTSSSIAASTPAPVNIGRELELEDARISPPPRRQHDRVHGRFVGGLRHVRQAGPEGSSACVIDDDNTLALCSCSAQIPRNCCSFRSSNGMAGRPRWRPQSWAILIGPNSAKNDDTSAFAEPSGDRRVLPESLSPPTNLQGPGWRRRSNTHPPKKRVYRRRLRRSAVHRNSTLRCRHRL